MKIIETTLRVIDAPLVEPVSVDLAKEYCRIYHEFEDRIVARMITSARMMVEQYSARTLVATDFLWTVRLHPHVDYRGGLSLYSNGNFGFGFGGSGIDRRERLELPRCPVQSVASVVVRGSDGVDTVLDDTGFLTDLEFDPARLNLLFDGITGMTVPPVWPFQHFQIGFTGGYGGSEYSEAIPEPLIQAVLLLVSWQYENRGDQLEIAEVPPSVRYLMDPYRVWFSGGQ